MIASSPAHAMRALANFFLHYFKAGADRAMFRNLEKRLDAIGAEVEREYPDQIPNVLHFSFSFSDKKEEFPLHAAIAIRSAIAKTGASRVFLCCLREPSGPHWKSVKKNITLIKLPNFNYFKNAKFEHYAHKSDVVRLLALHHIGGIYLDCDTITLRSMNDLRKRDFVMGVQGSRKNIHEFGLCNAIMLGRRHSAFSKRWLRSYASFWSRGRDAHWDFHSVKLPALLSREAPDEITVLSSRAFFYPLWTEIGKIVFAEHTGRNSGFFKKAYAVHLWSNLNPYLDRVDRAYLRKSSSLYAAWCRPYVKNK